MGAAAAGEAARAIWTTIEAIRSAKALQNVSKTIHQDQGRSRPWELRSTIALDQQFLPRATTHPQLPRCS
jgi:hypothetical protein